MHGHQLEKLWIIKQILLISTLWNIWGTIWRICILMLGWKVLTICFVSIGDKKRRDVVQCIVQVPKYDFYIIASQKGIICQWSSKVFINTHSLLIFLWFFPIQCYSVSKRKPVFNVSVMPKFTHAFDVSWGLLLSFNPYFERLAFWLVDFDLFPNTTTEYIKISWKLWKFCIS